MYYVSFLSGMSDNSISTRTAHDHTITTRQNSIMLMMLTCARAALSSDGMPTMDPTRGDMKTDVTAETAEAAMIAGNSEWSFSECAKILKARAAQAGPSTWAK